ncbi:MAG: YibE/F family protein [Candidatus Uhrbacteria bacterium]|nr:YibE/F family protein [Candidatus Uhrbacteria bacterium]
MDTNYQRGVVIRILEDEIFGTGGMSERHQVLEVEIAQGTTVEAVADMPWAKNQTGFEAGDRLIVSTMTIGEETSYVVTDALRLPDVGLVVLCFIAIACWFGRRHGAMSLVGLAVSTGILVFGVAPAILAGYNALWVCTLGGAGILVVSLLLAHGFNRRTFVALGATLLALLIAVVGATAAVDLIGLSGAGTEEAIFLQVGAVTGLSLRGVLLGGMIIGVLGVLDDVTTAQSAAVEEIAKADNTLTARELYRRGLSVGREHIASLVNTLALAYAGASFPLFLLLTMKEGPPWWVVLNSEAIVEEVVRALVGGASLILAVPIATVFAARVFARR